MSWERAARVSPMVQGEFSEDLAFVLSFIPFLASTAYALVLWIPQGLSATLPPAVFLAVTKDPILFLIGFFAVLAGAVIEVRGSDTPMARLVVVARRLQILAVIALLAALIVAWYATGYASAGDAVELLLAGRYAVIFPVALMLTSLGLGFAATRALDRRLVRAFASVVLMAASAAVLFAGSRSIAPWPILVMGAAVLLIGGIILLLRTEA